MGKGIKKLVEDLELANMEIVRQQASVAEARNEAATIRRAYLHEKGRAEKAIRVLKQHGYGGEALALERMAYRGPAERMNPTTPS